MKTQLHGTEETLLLPLWARAVESERDDAIVCDPVAVEIVRQLDIDFERFRHDWKSQVAVAVRTMLLDRAVRRFLDDHPAAVVVNLGAGLDSRYRRLDNGCVRWFELDLPDVIECRRRFFAESDRYRFIPASVMDLDWLGQIDEGASPVLLIAEGLLMYFPRHEVRRLLRALADRFPGADMLLEVLAFGAVGMTPFHDSLRHLGAPLKWSLTDCSELTRWDRRIRCLEEWCVLDYHRERWSWLALVADNPWFRLIYGEHILHLDL